MKSPKVSVVIPAYNQADYLGQAIQSTLDQTYQNWELTVIDDGSTDNTAKIVRRFRDPRISYIYQANKGLPGARNTGIELSSGEYLAFLDSDDYYHAEKLATQVAHLEQHPELGLSYTSRIDVDQEGNPLWLLRAPLYTSMEDMVLGFPFTINDLLMRREWAIKVGGFSDEFKLHSEDRDFYLRLILAGCQFAGIESFLAYRRLYKNRIVGKIAERLEVMKRVIDKALLAPECPPEAKALRDVAYAKIYLTWAYQEFTQDEIDAAQEYLEEAVSLDPSLLLNHAEKLITTFTWASIRDGTEHEPILRRLFTQLPARLAWLEAYMERAIAEGYLKKALCDLMWERDLEAKEGFKRAIALNAQIDKPFLWYLSEQLFIYEIAFGAAKTQAVFEKLLPHLKKIGPNKSIRWLHGYYAITQAFKKYEVGDYNGVPQKILNAIFHDPNYLKNLGVLSMLVRSMIARAW
jgi:glycosyltransferase involved in cell wall biosynthesis